MCANHASAGEPGRSMRLRMVAARSCVFSGVRLLSSKEILSRRSSAGAGTGLRRSASTRGFTSGLPPKPPSPENSACAAAISADEGSRDEPDRACAGSGGCGTAPPPPPCGTTGMECVRAGPGGVPTGDRCNMPTPTPAWCAVGCCGACGGSSKSSLEMPGGRGRGPPDAPDVEPRGEGGMPAEVGGVLSECACDCSPPAPACCCCCACARAERWSGGGPSWGGLGWLACTLPSRTASMSATRSG
mmetsp:Transcript_6450/g.18720  ORF Transcript_6450/g.18720 Transcript_6450/m.18720 type:complete len:245 (+) Transcript_6450:828-1562(+)